MKYKEGDKVRVRSKEWYDNNKSRYNDIECGNYMFYGKMSYWCGKVVNIQDVYDGFYRIREDGNVFKWTDEMFEGLVEEVGLVDNLSSRWVNEFSLPDGYIFKDENGNVINATKIVLEKKKKEYPKTYEECCKVLGVDPDNYLTIRNVYRYDGEEETTDYEKDHLGKFDSLWELRICRDAYWKIAGEEMGLGKPWEPDWNNISDKYCIYFVSGYAWSKECQTRQCPFAFPTPEMRDAFKENFDPDLEFCKELL